MVVGLLAVLKAGGAYVPLDPEYPAERLAFMLEDSAPVAILSHSGLNERVATLLGKTTVTIPVLDLKTTEPLWNQQPLENPVHSAVGLTSQNLAYVIYTSGSTGTPKGVMIEHRNVVNFIQWSRVTFDRLLECALFSTSISFDLAVFECFGALSVGGSVRIVDDALDLVSVPRPVTLINTVPSVLKALVDVIGVPPGVRCVSVAGEPLNRQLVDRLFATSKVERVYNLYAPTETTTYSTSASIRRGGTILPPIGRPIANTRIYILDGQMEPVPVGVMGEIYIGGAGVARGYLKRPELTAERFLIDPFCGEAEARIYKTGDLARYLADGNIEFLGRNDFQVKIRGFRIELGEIEARLAEHEGVQSAVVVAREDSPGDKRLVAYYVTASEAKEGEGDAASLRQYLSERLPDHMVPAAYVRLEVLPLTPNGKLDRKALPAPDALAYVVREYEPPQGEVERTLAEIWQQLLKVERVGRHDNFFELGGHSLLAVQVISRVRQLLGVEVTLSALFSKPMLTSFAGGISEAIPATLPAITPVEGKEREALSFAQQRLWFLAQLDQKQSQAYHIPFGLRLSGVLDEKALVKTLDRLVARHEVLRTTFIAIDGEPVQRIIAAEESHFPLVEHDLRGQVNVEAEAELERLALEEAGAPFDLERGPLIRGRLIRTEEQEHLLLITMHHIVSDGWSMGVLFRELSALYQAYRQGEADPLPPLAVQYADYAAWQRRCLAGAVLQEQAEYWKVALAGAPALLELPADRPRPVQQDFAGAMVACNLDDELTKALKALSQRHSTTLFMTLLAGWAVLLARLSGQPEVVIGTPSANRNRREIEELIGFFVNTLALRVDVSGSPTVGELLERVKAVALGAQQHQDIPFEQVVQIMHPERSLSHNPLFQVMFIWQNTPEGDLQLHGLKLAPFRGVPHATASFDLSLSLMEVGERIAGGVEYATALFDRSTVELYLSRWRTLLKAMVADDHQRVDHLPLLSEAERNQWNSRIATITGGTALETQLQSGLAGS